MEYTVFRNLKRPWLLKELEQEYIHEERRKYDNEAIENGFLRCCLVKTTAIINNNCKTSIKPHSRTRN